MNGAFELKSQYDFIYRGFYIPLRVARFISIPVLEEAFGNRPFLEGSETVFIVYSWGWVHVSTGSLSGEGGEFILPDRSVRGILLYYENYFTLKLRRVKKLLFRMLLRNDACVSAELALSLEYRYYYSFTSSDRQYDNKKTTMLILSGFHTLCRNLQEGSADKRALQT